MLIDASSLMSRGLVFRRVGIVASPPEKSNARIVISLQRSLNLLALRASNQLGLGWGTPHLYFFALLGSVE